MSRWIQLLAAGLVGAVVGFSAAQPLYKVWIGRDLQAIGSKFYSIHQYAGTLSLAALGKLEGGDTENAKVILAREVATWYRDSYRWSKPEECNQMRASIEEMSGKSEVLKKELAKTSDGSRP